jgi:hypothetical protein
MELITFAIKIWDFPLTAVAALNYVEYVCFICLFTDRYERDTAQWVRTNQGMVSASTESFASGIQELLL